MVVAWTFAVVIQSTQGWMEVSVRDFATRGECEEARQEVIQAAREHSAAVMIIRACRQQGRQ